MKKNIVITAICIALIVAISICASACTRNADVSNTSPETSTSKVSAVSESKTSENEFSAEVYPGSRVDFNKSTGMMTINSSGVLPWSDWNVQVEPLFAEKGCSMEDVKKIVITEGVTVFNVGDFCSYKNLTEITIPKTTKVIARVRNFNNPYSRPDEIIFHYFNINKINYGGSEKDWAKIRKETDIDPEKCTINYSASVPKCSGFEKTKLNNEIISDTIPNTNITCTANLLTGKLTIKGKGKVMVQDQLFYNFNSFLTIMYNDDQSLVSPYYYIDEIIIEEGISELDEGVARLFEFNKITLPKSLKKIGAGNFNSNKAVNVFYNGSENDWSKIKIADENNTLTKSKIRCAE